ncbi:hypothetical protein Ga0080574_TMP4653 [Salipiger abyssi]|uniref:DUF2489 domain-containing protein n=2 Tax=Salipiger abyssi TaxID=1250539 RepID=A0A1P8V034_9RHOB|nr:hypothetical protein Ga0080574_TMP4653 [Salipiger abyssi]
MHWTNYFSSLAPTFVALIVAYIAFQQWQTNRTSLRERLFDRRLEIFEETHTFLSEVIHKGTISETSIFRFHAAIHKGEFLFESDVISYMNEIRIASVKLLEHETIAREATNKEERQENIKRKYEKLGTLDEKIENIFDVFRPYLHFAR